MNNYFGSIYNWFVSLYGDSMNYFLWGYDPGTGAYTNANIYNHIGLCTTIISIVIVILYYLIIDHPRFSKNAFGKWFSWFLTMCINSIIALFVGFGIVYGKYNNGSIPDQLLYQRDENGNIIAQLIDKSNCWGVGIANIFVAAIFFIVLSFIFKWFSRNSKHNPV